MKALVINCITKKEEFKTVEDIIQPEYKEVEKMDISKISKLIKKAEVEGWI